MNYWVYAAGCFTIEHQGGHQHPRETGVSKPNILVIQADQLTALCLQAYGTPYALTPHIDRIAERGKPFSTAIATALYVARHALR